MKKLFVALFWGGVFLSFMTPMELGDIWWHLATGKWIIENRFLPEIDPFSFAPASDGLVLKGFWLCQIVLYQVWKLLGLWGLIALKAAVFTSTFYVLLKLINRAGFDFPWAYLSVLPVIFIASFYDEIRPQSFTFLFFTATLYILELGGPVWALPPLMLIWANIHPGFVAGDALITVYFMKALFTKPLNRSYVLAATLSIVISGLNPNGFDAFWRTGEQLGGAAIGRPPDNLEYLPPKVFASTTGEHSIYPAILVVAVVGSLGFLLRAAYGLLKRKHLKDCLDPVRFLLFAAFAYSAIMTFRAGMFFAILSAVVTAANLSAMRASPGSGKAEAPREPDKKHTRRNLLATAASIALVVSAFLLIYPRSVFTRPLMGEGIFPEKAASFIDIEGLPPNVYHPYEWGGYLIWRLYPRYKSFADGRGIGPVWEQKTVLYANPGYDLLLKKYHINTVVYWPLLPYTGRVPPIIFALLKDDGWAPVYWDLQSVVFVRSRIAKSTISKKTVYELLTSLTQMRILYDPSRAGNYTALGEVCLERGLKVDARDEFRKALSINPEDREAVFYLQTLE